MKHAVSLIILSTILFGKVYAQKQAYFVDGYHGGVYGHYPMWVTQFMLDNLSQHPEWRIGLEIEPETWDTVKVNEPEAYSNFKQIIGNERVEFTNPTYAQPYCYNISGESLIRQFEYGIQKTHQHFPDVIFTTYSAEEPCFTSSLPQILRLFGFKYAVLKCPDTCWGGYTAAYGGQLVNWIGPDGTSMLTVPRYAAEELEENSTWQTKAWNNSASYLQACFDYGIKNPVGMCYQDAGWKNGPWIGHGNNIKSNSIYVTWKEYIEKISEGKSNDDWYFSQEDILVNLMWGSQVLQKIAQEVRTSENKIIMAEKVAAMATIENGYTPTTTLLDDAWRTLMMAQHHDSWIVPYNRLNKNRTWAQEISLWTNNTNSISDNIISEAINSDKSSSRNNTPHIKVYNTLGIKRSELVKINISDFPSLKEVALVDSKNKLIPYYIEQNADSLYIMFNAEVPAFGYATYSLIKKKQSITKKYSVVEQDQNGYYTIENNFYKIVMDPARGGTITSLISKTDKNKEYVDLNNEFNFGEVRGFFYDENKFHSTADYPAKITVIENNLFRTVIQTEGEIASHPFVQTLTLVDGQKRIDFDFTIDWKYNVGIGEYKQGDNWRDNRRAFTDDRFKLNIMFPTAFSSGQIYKNAPFDVCESNLENTFFSTWDSIKHNIILNWIDLVDKKDNHALALLSDHTTSYSYGKDFPLSLTAQYSGKGLWGMDYKITGPLKMRYALIPHSRKWDEAKISTESNKWNEPLISSLCKGKIQKNKSYLDINNTGYEITAFKQQGNDIIVRLFNAEGNDSFQNIQFGFPILSVDEVDLRGNLLTKHKVDKDKINISIPRFGIKTLLVRRITK